MAEDKKIKLTPYSENLESALKVWWKNLKKFIFIYLWGALFAAISALIAGAILVVGVLFSLKGTNQAAMVIAYILAFVAILFVFYYSIRSYIGSFLLVKKDFAGVPHDIFKESKTYFWPYLGLSLLTIVLVLLWSLLLIIPGIIYAIFYSFACYVFFFEDKRGLDAIRRSKELVSGYWWDILGRFAVIGLLTWLVMFVVSFPLIFIGRTGVFYQAWNVVIQLVSFLIGPIVLLYTYNIYQNLVKFKK